MVSLKGMIEGKNCVGRLRQSSKAQIMKYTECKSYSEMNRLAQDKEKWRIAPN